MSVPSEHIQALVAGLRELNNAERLAKLNSIMRSTDDRERLDRNARLATALREANLWPSA
jgi:hypothetical protein